MKPISEMTDQEIVEAWFVEVHGATRAPDGWWIFGQEFGLVRNFGLHLPNILNSESAFNPWVNDYMEGQGWDLVTTPENSWWSNVKRGGGQEVRKSQIKNNRRFRAAVEAALQIIREGK